MPAKSDRAERVVDTAVEMAETVGWEGVRLRAVAEAAGVPLDELRTYYRDKDAVADAWLARADRAMLALPADRAFRALPARERIFQAITRWLDALAGHREVTGQILKDKLYFGHPHHNIALVLWVSRTVQWVREAALLDATGRQRRFEESGLTGVFVSTLWRWLRDDSPGQMRTRETLARRLDRADQIMARLWGGPRRAPAQPPAPGARTRPPARRQPAMTRRRRTRRTRR